MKKAVYEIDSDGFIVEVHVDKPSETEFITTDPPQGTYRPRWTGTKWVEDMSQEERDALIIAPKLPTQEDYLIDLDFRLSLIELGLFNF